MPACDRLALHSANDCTVIPLQEIESLRELFEELDGSHTGKIAVEKLQVQHSAHALQLAAAVLPKSSQGSCVLRGVALQVHTVTMHFWGAEQESKHVVFHCMRTGGSEDAVQPGRQRGQKDHCRT